MVVIRNSANVGFPQLIQGYKQSFTFIATRVQSFTIVSNVIYLPLISAIPRTFNCKSLFVLKTQNILNSGVTLTDSKVFVASENKDNKFYKF